MWPLKPPRRKENQWEHWGEESRGKGGVVNRSLGLLGCRVLSTGSNWRGVVRAEKGKNERGGGAIK